MGQVKVPLQSKKSKYKRPKKLGVKKVKGATLRMTDRCLSSNKVQIQAFITLDSKSPEQITVTRNRNRDSITLSNKEATQNLRDKKPQALKLKIMAKSEKSKKPIKQEAMRQKTVQTVQGQGEKKITKARGN